MEFIKFFLVASLLYIVYEDFRFRAISLYAILAFLALSVAYSWFSQNLTSLLSSMFLNLIVLLFQLSLTWLYFILFRKQEKGFINKKLGLGDLLFYVPVLFLFSPLNFIIFHILSLLLVLGAFILYGSIVKPVRTIPLAGGHSVVITLLFLFTWFCPSLNLYDDLFLADLLYSIYN